MSQGLSTSPMTVCTAEIAFAISHLTFRLMLHLALSVACSISLSWPILLSLSHASSCTLRSLHVRDVRHRVVEGKVNLICPKCVSLKRLSSQSLSTWPNHSIYHLSLQTWSKNMKTKPDSQLSLYEENVASNMHYQQKPKYIFESLQIYMIYILTGSKLPVNIWIAVSIILHSSSESLSVCSIIILLTVWQSLKVFTNVSNPLKVYTDPSVKRPLNVSCKDAGTDPWTSVECSSINNIARLISCLLLLMFLASQNLRRRTSAALEHLPALNRQGGWRNSPFS